MRALTSATGKALHIDGRERPYTRDGKVYVSPADGPLCNGMGAARGNVRWYTQNAEAATCKSCLRALDAAHTEALKMNEVESAAARERTRIAAQRAEFEQAATEVTAHEADNRSGMNVLLARGVTAFVEAGQRLRRADIGLCGTVDAVGPNAVDVTMDDGTRRSGASWQWEVSPEIVHTQKCWDNGEAATCGGSCTRSVDARGDRRSAEPSKIARCPVCEQRDVSPAHRTPLGHECAGSAYALPAAEQPAAELETPRQAAVSRLLTFEDFPRASRVVRKGDGVQGFVESRYSDGKLAVVMDDTSTVSTGHWSTFAPVALGEDRVLELSVPDVEADILEGALRRYAADPVRFDASRPEAAALAKRIATRTRELSEQEGAADQVHALMRDVRMLTRWLGMSEPVKLLSFRSPYDTPETATHESDESRRYAFDSPAACPGFHNGGVGRSCIRCGGKRAEHSGRRATAGPSVPAVLDELAEAQRCQRQARGTGPVFGGMVSRCEGSIRADGGCPNAANHV